MTVLEISKNRFEAQGAMSEMVRLALILKN